jgi:hypothetical protein
LTKARRSLASKEPKARNIDFFFHRRAGGDNADGLPGVLFEDALDQVVAF